MMKERSDYSYYTITGSRSGGVFDANGDDVPTVSYSSILRFINQPEQEPGAMEEKGTINYRK